MCAGNGHYRSTSMKNLHVSYQLGFDEKIRAPGSEIFSPKCFRKSRHFFLRETASVLANARHVVKESKNQKTSQKHEESSCKKTPAGLRACKKLAFRIFLSEKDYGRSSRGGKMAGVAIGTRTVGHSTKCYGESLLTPSASSLSNQQCILYDFSDESLFCTFLYAIFPLSYLPLATAIKDIVNFFFGNTTQSKK